MAETVRQVVVEMGQQSDPVREALRRMLAEFGDEHYHTCPADSDRGLCDCFAGHLVAASLTVLQATHALSDKDGK